MRLRKIRVISALVVCLVSSVFTNVALSAPSDYDGDGRADIGLALVNRQNSTTTWLARLSSGAPAKLYTFGLPGDALVVGRYYKGDEKWYPGIVFVRDITRPLEWYIKNRNGKSVFVPFGIPGDTIPNQNDVDCDGITDFVVVRNGATPGALRRWYVALSGDGGRVVRTDFGLSGDKVFTADLDGDNCRELVALRPSTFVWYGKKLFSTKISQVQWGLPQTGDIPLLPQDINGDGKPDYMISRPSGSKQNVFVRFSSSSSTTIPLGTASTIPLVGHILGAKGHKGKGFAFWDRRAGILGIRNQNASVQTTAFGIPSNALIRPDGTVIQPNDTGRVGGNTGPITGGVRCDKNIDTTDGHGKGFTNNPDNSRGTLKIILERNTYTNKTRAVAAFHNGELFDVLRRATPNEGGDRQRYYGTEPIGDYPDNLVVVVELFTGEQHCALLPDPQRRYD